MCAREAEGLRDVPSKQGREAFSADLLGDEAEQQVAGVRVDEAAARIGREAPFSQVSAAKRAKDQGRVGVARTASWYARSPP